MKNVQTAAISEVALTTDGDSRLAWRKVAFMSFCAACVFLLASSVRHFLMRSGAMDLGFFDQAVYLISSGRAPVTSMHRFHVLGDHASLILYAVALLYKVWTDPHVLLALQATVLAAGAWPVFRLSRNAGIAEKPAMAIAGAYLMYPLILTANIFDFHPEVIAVPALLMAVLAARENRRVAFCIWMALALACKEIMSVTVAGMGFYLLVIERRRFAGTVALVGGLAWFVIASKVIIPHFGAGRNPSGLQFYAYLGSSISEVLINSLKHPQLVLGHLFAFPALKYTLVLVVPIIWALHPKTIWPLLAAVPAISLNLLSNFEGQQSPFSHYSLPIVPFVFVTIVAAVAANKAWFTNARSIVGWSVMMLVVGGGARLARMERGRTFDWESLRHTKAAIAMIDDHANVLTTFEIVPQLSERPVIDYFNSPVPHRPLDQYDYVLVNLKHASLDDKEFEDSNALIQRIAASSEFTTEYAAPNVYLYKRIGATTPAVVAANH